MIPTTMTRLIDKVVMEARNYYPRCALPPKGMEINIRR